MTVTLSEKVTPVQRIRRHDELVKKGPKASETSERLQGSEHPFSLSVQFSECAGCASRLVTSSSNTAAESRCILKTKHSNSVLDDFSLQVRGFFAPPIPIFDEAKFYQLPHVQVKIYLKLVQSSVNHPSQIPLKPIRLVGPSVMFTAHCAASHFYVFPHILFKLLTLSGHLRPLKRTEGTIASA